MSASTSLNTGQPARDIGYGVVQAIVKQITYATPGVGTADTVKIGTLPLGAVITNVIARIETAFNAATTNVIIVGTSTGSNADVIADGDLDETATGTTQVMRGVGLSITADTAIYAKYSQTGTAATAGVATFVINFVVPANG